MLLCCPSNVYTMVFAHLTNTVFTFLLLCQLKGMSGFRLSLSSREPLSTNHVVYSSHNSMSDTQRLEEESLCIIKTCSSLTSLDEREECISSCTSTSDQLQDDEDGDMTDTGDVTRDVITSQRDFITTTRKRQIDPLQSCIEAKCSGILGHRYGDCVFTRCIMGMGLTFSNKAREKKDELSRDLLSLQHDVFSRHSLMTSWGKTSRRQKKSWNDVMKTCVDFHCTDNAPGSLEYTVCVHTHCGRIANGKR